MKRKKPNNQIPTLHQKKLTFNITYYPVFQNVRNILQELHILLTPDQEHKKVFPGIPVAGFRNGKSLKDQLVIVKLANLEIAGRSELCWKGNCQVCYFIIYYSYYLSIHHCYLFPGY